MKPSQVSPETSCGTMKSAAATRGIGCRFGETWHVDLAVALPDGDFTPASSGSVASLDAYLDALGARGPLDPEKEAGQD